MMSALDMSLDDIIKSNKKSSTHGSGGRVSDLGPARRYFKRGVSRKALYSKLIQAPQATWRHACSSTGTAEIVFTRRTDAVSAVKRSNNVQLDGKPMKIEIIGTNIGTHSAAPPATNGMYRNQNNASRSFSHLRRGGAIGRSGHGDHENRGGHGRGRGRGQGAKPNLSLEDLDADLDKYHEETKQSDGMVQ